MSRHASKFVEPLSESDRQYLDDVWRKHGTYTVRCRAHAILLSDLGYQVSELQDIFGISKPTALSWIDRWETCGREGLEDAPRPGGPPTLSDEEVQNIVKPLLERFPRDPKRVLRGIQEQTGKQISRTTLQRICHKLGLRWKRFRRSERKQRDEKEFRAAMDDLIELQAIPDVELAYFDEAGFSTQATVPYGWQPIGERIEIPVGADRAAVQVLGIQEEDQGNIYGYLHRGTVKGTTVVEVLDDYSQRIKKPTVLVLDNASVHTCNLVADYMDRWNERGLYFYFLPPHSPELNAIERLWKKLKYQVLPIDCWEHLSSIIDSLIDAFRKTGKAFVLPSLQT